MLRVAPRPTTVLERVGPGLKDAVEPRFAKLGEVRAVGPFLESARVPAQGRADLRVREVAPLAVRASLLEHGVAPRTAEPELGEGPGEHAVVVLCDAS